MQPTQVARTIILTLLFAVTLAHADTTYVFQGPTLYEKQVDAVFIPLPGCGCFQPIYGGNVIGTMTGRMVVEDPPSNAPTNARIKFLSLSVNGNTINSSDNTYFNASIGVVIENGHVVSWHLNISRVEPGTNNAITGPEALLLYTCSWCHPSGPRSVAFIGSYPATPVQGYSHLPGTWVNVGNTPNQPPTASFTFTPQNPAIGEAVTFTSTSTDADGHIVEWLWDFGDGTPGGTGERVTHTFRQDGNFTVALLVTDDRMETSVPAALHPIGVGCYPLPVKRLGQDDPLWGDALLGDTMKTLRAKGCAVTALAMALNFVNVAITPGELNAAIRQDGWFSETGSIQSWSKATLSGVGKPNIHNLKFHDLNRTGSLTDLSRALCQNEGEC